MASSDIGRDAVKAIFREKGAVPPQNLDLERYVLATCIEYADTFLPDIRAFLEPDHFWIQPHEYAYAAALHLFDAGRPVNAESIGEVLRAQGKMRAEERVDLLHALACTAVNHIHALDHARVVYDLWRQRQGIARLQSHAAEGYSTPNVDAWIAEARSHLDAIDAPQGAVQAKHIADPIDAIAADLRNGGADRGLDTGIADLDRLLNGMHPGEVHVIMAKTSRGKTALALGAAVQVATVNRRGALIQSGEMSDRAMAKRSLSQIAHIDGGLFNARRAHELLADADALERLKDAVTTLRHAPLYVDDRSGLSLPEIRRDAVALKRFLAKMGVDLALVALDYLQLFRSGEKHQSREQEVAAAMRGAKSLAKFLGCVVVVLSQTNEEGKSRESRGIENDADSIILIDAPAYEERMKRSAVSDDPEECKLIVSKRRGEGTTGTCDALFWPKFTLFTSMSRQS